jgi:RNA polymerase sigma-70 factor (ECF subfamily)
VAQDLTQDAFAKAWRALPDFRPDHEQAWLYRIAHRVAIDHIRHRNLLRFQPWDAYAAAFHPSQVAPDRAEDGALAAERRGLVLAVLRRLRPDYAAALVAYEYEGLSYEECGRRFGASRDAFKFRLYRARGRFAALWAEASPEPPPGTAPARDSRRRPRPRRGAPRTGRSGGRGGSGVTTSTGYPKSKPWRAQPWDPQTGAQRPLGYFATRAAAAAAVEAWRAAQRQAQEQQEGGTA